MYLLLVTSFPFLIQLTAILSSIAFIIICATIVFIFINRIRKAGFKRDIVKAEKIVYEDLSDNFLIYNTLSEIPEEKLEQELNRLSKLKNSSKIFRQALIETMVKFKLNLSGTMVEIIEVAYLRLGLNKLVVSKLKSSIWSKRAEALNQIQEMNDHSSLAQVDTATKDPNIDVRVNAYAALIRLSASNRFTFLTEEKQQLSAWHQVYLLDAVSKSTNLQLPDFSDFLKVDNKSIISLCIKIIVHYKRFETIPTMIGLLNRRDEELNYQLIEALGLLNAEEAEEGLKEIYQQEPENNKSQILLALGNIASGASLHFINTEFLKNSSHLLLKSATQAMAQHRSGFTTQVLQMTQNLTDGQQLMLKHFKEPLNLHGIL